jgi:3'-phosphoadenosine 5'-phosphosulfate (PAPS) 3'-phosphatase
MTSLDNLLHAAQTAAGAAADVHRRSRSIDPSAWIEKGHADWVSEVDHAAEKAVVTELRGAFPDHAIVAEESDWGGPTPDEAEITWARGPPSPWLSTRVTGRRSPRGAAKGPKKMGIRSPCRGSLSSSRR